MTSQVLGGVWRALLLSPGVVPLGLVFGATAAAAGFHPFQAAIFSSVVFAGATQFAAVAAMETGAVLATLIGIVFLLNVRYLLLSVATLDLARQTGMARPLRILLALGVVEESYALQSAWHRTHRLSASGLLAVPATLMVLWTGSTLAGAAAGAHFPPMEPLGLDYALPGIFVGLLGIFSTSRTRLVAGLLALTGGGALAVIGLTPVAILLVPPAIAIAFGYRNRPTHTDGGPT